MFFDNTTGFMAPRSTTTLPPTFTHSFTPNDFKILDDDAIQDLGKQEIQIQDTKDIIKCYTLIYCLSSIFCHIYFLADGTFRYFQRTRNNEVCEARGGQCKQAIDLFSKNLRKPNPVPEDLYKYVNYTNNLNWLIMSSEGTGNRKPKLQTVQFWMENIEIDIVYPHMCKIYRYF